MHAYFRTFIACFENHSVLLSQKETKQDAHIGGRLLWSMITISHFLSITMMIPGVTDPGEAP